MTQSPIETVMGAVVLLVAAIFLVFAYTSAATHSVAGYEVSAKFDRIEGIRDGGDVRISGIKVGTIASTTLDKKTFQAIVRMTIDKSIALPTDTVATITSSGLLGDKFLQLVPGADDAVIAPGGVIKFTQAPMNLESLLGQAVFSAQGTPKPAADAAPSHDAASH